MVATGVTMLMMAALLTVGHLASRSLAAQGEGDALLARLPFSSRWQIAEWVNQGVDVWEVQERYVLAHLTPAQSARLRTEGIALTEEPLPAGYAAYPACYRTYSDTVAFLRTLSETYPSLVTLFDVGDSWEKTKALSDRDVWAARLTAADVPGPKPKLFVVAEHHARELITPEVAMLLASLLTEGYGNDAQATWLLNEREVWVVPMANPDGHVQAEQNEDWRKNTDTDDGDCPGSSSPNSYGVDLNRNYGWNWGGVGGSPSPCNLTYRGVAAFSEPETQAIRDLVSAQQPDILISLHSYQDQILYPWNSTITPPPDEDGLRALASRMARYNGYTYGQPSVILYPVSGDTTDWAYGTFGIPSYTIEIGGSGDGQFWPPCWRVDTLWGEVRDSLLFAAAAADAPYDRAHGPDVTALQVATHTLAGGPALTMTAQIRDPDGGGDYVAAAEVSFDKLAAAGAGQPLTSADGSFDQATETVSDALSLAGMAPGSHLLFVRGQDQEGNWGPPDAARFSVGEHGEQYFLPMMSAATASSQ